MRFEIRSFESAGPVKLGMTIDEVRKTLGPDFTPIQLKDHAYPRDYYESVWVRADYKTPGVLESLEFAEPADLTWEGHSLLAMPAEDLKALLLSRDPDLDVDGYGFIAHNLGIGAYAPDFDEDPREPVEAVIVFEKGYYEGIRPDPSSSDS